MISKAYENGAHIGVFGGGGQGQLYCDLLRFVFDGVPTIVLNSIRVKYGTGNRVAYKVLRGWKELVNVHRQP